MTQTAPLELVFSKKTKIKHLENLNEVTKLLNYLYVLLNVKKDNQLNEIEESVLNGLILNNFNNFTIDEIKHAFRLGVAGDLNIELYNKLDGLTFGKVLTHYKKYKADKIKNHNKTIKINTEMTKQEKIAIEQEFEKNCIAPYFSEIKELEKPKISWEAYAIFKHFYDKNKIKLNNKKKAKYEKEALILYKEDLTTKKAEGQVIDLGQIWGNRTKQLYCSCVALYHEADNLNKEKEIDEKGLNDKL